MKTEVKKKFALNAVPEAALEEAGLAKETILAAIPMDGVVLVTKDSMPIVELLQMLDRLNLYAAEMLTAVAAECGPCEKADEALTVEDVLEECEVTIPAWAREQAGIPENAKLACFVNEGEVIVGEAEACAPDLADVPRYVLKFFVDNHLNLRALDDMLNVWITPVPCSCEVSGDAE
jgi:bifunctional DNA-binding transcriptional regulator/antitoxin component of YhaV-PrlF toxin-antitoxin module